MRLPISLCLLLTVTACDRVQPRMEITETRVVSDYARKPAIDIPSSTRFFDDASKDENGNPKQHPLVWKTPEGWSEGPPSQMRLIDLKFGPEKEGECYLSAMPGAAGGLLANVNRWRTQMGQPVITEADLEKLPKKKLMGSDCYFTTIDGDFKGMGDVADAKKNYRLVGIIQSAPELTIFVKMTGPKALVEANQAAFDTFISSVQFRKKEDIPMH